MSEIRPAGLDIPVIHTDDVYALYTGAEDHQKIGLEIEQMLYYPDALETLKAQESEALALKGTADGVPVNHEPSATSLETITDAFTPGDLPALIAQTEARFDYFRNLTAEAGLAISPFGHLPHIFPTDHEVVSKERFQTFFNPPRSDMQEVFKFFANSMNIQVSVSYRDPTHLLRIIRMAVALEPLFFLITDSNSGFFENKPIDYSLNLHLNQGKGINGGVPDFYYTVRTGEELIRAHIDFTLNHRHMFAHFDFGGKLRKLPAGEWVAFSDLERLNLGPQTMLNYRQAQSESWRRAINISPIVDESGSVIGHRAEFAPFQTGLMHQRATAPLLTGLIAFNDGFYDATEILLRECGIDLAALDKDRNILEANFQAACYHGNAFHDVRFGAKTIRDFAVP
ncbi:MAG: hypothetical protein K9G62_05790, partial [Alphaproteobacteria bacterium]|nr:hypothetical protein [Alphaproteobacteria bacterium]